MSLYDGLKSLKIHKLMSVLECVQVPYRLDKYQSLETLLLAIATWNHHIFFFFRFFLFCFSLPVCLGLVLYLILLNVCTLCFVIQAVLLWLVFVGISCQCDSYTLVLLFVQSHSHYCK